jgi:hypothetical protein
MIFFDTPKRNSLLFQEMDQILSNLGEASIEVVELKGAALANTVYEDIGLRWMSDLDLLVPIDRLEETVDIASSLGYRDPYPDVAPGLNEKFSHHFHLQGRQNREYILELITSLVVAKSFRYAVRLAGSGSKPNRGISQFHQKILSPVNLKTIDNCG